MKIVINSCFGGFGLSNKAIKRYAELSGLSLEPRSYPEDPESIFWYNIDTGTGFLDWEIPRDDPNLIKVVEEFGAEANGNYAKLEIVEVGNYWSIHDNDGNETID